MGRITCFLTLEEDAPLGVYLADNFGQEIMPIGEFLEESKIDLSCRMAERYADAFQAFVDDLREYAKQEDVCRIVSRK